METSWHLPAPSQALRKDPNKHVLLLSIITNGIYEPPSTAALRPLMKRKEATAMLASICKPTRPPPEEMLNRLEIFNRNLEPRIQVRPPNFRTKVVRHLYVAAMTSKTLRRCGDKSMEQLLKDVANQGA